MTDWLSVKSTNPDIIHVSLANTNGGKELHVNISSEMAENLRWLREHRHRMEREQQIRSQDPAAKELFDQYTTYINLTYSK